MKEVWKVYGKTFYSYKKAQEYCVENGWRIVSTETITYMGISMVRLITVEEIKLPKESFHFYKYRNNNGDLCHTWDYEESIGE